MRLRLPRSFAAREGFESPWSSRVVDFDAAD